jgi:hypothetical protein
VHLFLEKVKYMCMYSVTAGNSRDARQGEDLVVTRAPHGGSNWLTEAGKSAVAVCVRNTAVLAVQLPNESVRGASFEQALHPDEQGNRDFLNYLDGERERLALNVLPAMTRIRVLHLFANSESARALVVPAILNSSAPPDSESEGDMVGAGVSGRSRASAFTRFFRLPD